MATAGELSTTISEIGSISDGVLSALATVDPAVALPAEIIETIEQLATKAFSAWTAAAGIDITVTSVQALLPNATPLTAPKTS